MSNHNLTELVLSLQLQLDQQSASISSLSTTLSSSSSSSSLSITDLQNALDTCWVLICTYLVFIMQLGFALLEAGSVRAMNTKNILMQNILDTLISIIMFWFIGYGIATGSHDDPGFGNLDNAVLNDREHYASFIFLWAFCNCATTIVSGAVTSRIKFSTYMASCIVISGFTFPVVAYWTWGGGWLGVSGTNSLGVIDFAGGTVVHILGGTCGLVGAIIVGPRSGRFTVDEKTGKPVDNKESGHSVVIATIGTFLLWFGWFGFNSGSTQAMSRGNYLVAANCAVNSLIAGASGGIVITVYHIQAKKVHDLWELLNGMLCGLVAITPCCATVDPWAAIIIGGTSVFSYMYASKLLSKFKIDDVVDAFSVHGACGLHGTLCAGLFSTQINCDRAYGVGAINFSVGHQLGIQILSASVCIAFSGSIQALLFFILKVTVGIRVSEGDERVGLDFKYHAGYAYPDFNQRVKKAHEQMQMEAEIAQQVRKEVGQGRGGRFKEVTSALPNATDGGKKSVPRTPSNGSGLAEAGREDDSRGPSSSPKASILPTAESRVRNSSVGSAWTNHSVAQPKPLSLAAPNNRNNSSNVPSPSSSASTHLPSPAANKPAVSAGTRPIPRSNPSNKFQLQQSNQKSSLQTLLVDNNSSAVEKELEHFTYENDEKDGVEDIHPHPIEGSPTAGSVTNDDRINLLGASAISTYEPERQLQIQEQQKERAMSVESLDSIRHLPNQLE